MTTYTGRRVTVVGLGREGLAVTRVLAREGARVTVSDTRAAAALAPQLAALSGLDVRLSLGGNRPDEVLDCDLLVLSPGVDKRAPIVQEALRRGVRISSETELFFERCRARVIGVTGSAGKTTTTTLIGAMLEHGVGPGRALVGGNIGRPLLEQASELAPDSWVVLELSSFQLEWLQRSPHVAVVTNITPNHLDRHETMVAYVAAKANVVAHQGADGIAVLNRDDPTAARLAARTRGRLLYFSLVCPERDGAFLDGDVLILARDAATVPLCRADELRVPGRHNVANALAAASAAGACGVEPAAIGTVIRRFGGVAHRLQWIETIDGVAYYDDSIATAPERTLAALAALAAPVVLILGGRDKHLPWDELARAAVRRCRGVVLIGEAAPLIRDHLERALAVGEGLLRREAIVAATAMGDAVERAAALARRDDAVVLAPGCTSYDMYRDFEERGEDFARVVRRLASHV